MLIAIDIFFTTFHTCLVLFNLFGWIWKRTRLINLVTILLTGGSWIVLGLFYGFGYCPLTDWHFNVLQRLGHANLPNSYISFLITRLTGLEIRQSLVDSVTYWGLLSSLAISVFLNIRDLIKKKRSQ